MNKTNKITNGLDKIFNILFKIPKNKNKKKLDFKNVKKWDSLSHVKLIILLENEFDIKKISPDESLNLISYQQIFNFLKKKFNKINNESL